MSYSLNIMLSVSFSRGRACRHCWISYFWTPSGNGGDFFRGDHLFSPLAGYVFDFFYKNHIKSQIIKNNNLLASRQETFADTGDGDGGGTI